MKRYAKFQLAEYYGSSYIDIGYIYIYIKKIVFLPNFRVVYHLWGVNINFKKKLMRVKVVPFIELKKISYDTLRSDH